MGADPYFEHLNKVEDYRRQQQGESEERSRRHRWFFYLRLAVGLAIVLVLFGAIFAPDWYLEAPGPARCLRNNVNVEGKATSGSGCIFAVTVVTKRANWAERVSSLFRNDDTLVSGETLRRNHLIFEAGDRAFWRKSRIYSERVAEAVALRNAKYQVLVKPQGVRIGAISPSSPASRTLAFGDTILSANGQSTLTTSRLRAVISRQRVGAALRLAVLRGGVRKQIAVRTYAPRSSSRTSSIGAYMEQALSVTSSTRIRFHNPNYYGPWGGLAYALELADRLDPKIDRGYRIAATGQLELNGRVLPTWGAEQKARAATRAGIEVFIVPAGENAGAVGSYARKMKVISVTSFQQALRELAKLPRKPGS